MPNIRTKIPTTIRSITHQYMSVVINKIVDSLKWISPLHNDIIGQAEPNGEYLRTGTLAYCTYVSTWQPTSNGLLAKYAGSYTTIGGSSFESITVTGVTASDYAFVSVKTPGSIGVIPVAWACNTDSIDITFSGDPGSDTVINYLVFRTGSEGLWRYDSNGEWVFVG